MLTIQRRFESAIHGIEAQTIENVLKYDKHHSLLSIGRNYIIFIVRLYSSDELGTFTVRTTPAWPR